MFHTLLVLFYLFVFINSYCTASNTVMCVPVMLVSAYMALAFVFGFIQIN